MLRHLFQGSARQLFQRLQGPVEEDTIREHFDKIIQIGQKQRQRRIQVGPLPKLALATSKIEHVPNLKPKTFPGLLACLL